MNTVTVTAQGRLLQVKCSGFEAPEYHPKRGTVDTFSKESRLRLLRLLSRIQAPESKGYVFKVSFLTLTTKVFYHPQKMKAFLILFFKRLVRKYPTMSMIWRMEYQERGAPHFHVILYNAPWIDKEWIQKAWGEIVGQDRPFTRIEKIKSYRHLMRYASKYAAKVDGSGFNIVAYLAAGGDKSLENSPAGRVWGVWNRHYLPFADEITVVLPFDTSWFLVRKYCRTFSDYISDDLESGWTIFCDNPYQALHHIEKLHEFFSNNS